MTTEHAATGLIGASIRRVEDAPLITGRGCYTEDIQLPGTLHMALLRSPLPHAKIVSIDTGAAKAMAGVTAVVIGDDLSKELHVSTVPMVAGMKIPPHPLLARGSVHAIGAPVAAVLAKSRAVAEDAASVIDVEYEALPAVVNAEKALEPGAPLAREELDSNLCYIATKKGGDVDKAFAEAEHIVRLRIASPRLVAVAMEPRGLVAKPEPNGDLTAWLSTQSPHRVRTELATAIGLPEHRIRIIAPDVGGGFGSKGLLYQEDALACHLALKLGRPIKWIATRSEDFVTTNQGRDQVMTSELALKRDGTMLGLKVRVVGNMGAYLNSLSVIPPLRMMAMAPGCYQIQNCSVEVVAVFTNTVPTGPYRGAGRPESVLNIERLIDKAAHEFLPHLPRTSTGAYMYTPLVAGFFAPLSLMGPNLSLLIWQALSVLALALSCWFMAQITATKTSDLFYLSFLYGPVFLTLWAGQLGLAFGLAPLCAGYYLLLRQWPLAAGLVWSLLLLKPQYFLAAAFVALILAMIRRYRAFLGMALGVVILFALTVIVFSPELTLHWLKSHRVGDSIFSGGLHGIPAHLITGLPANLMILFSPDVRAALKCPLYAGSAVLWLVGFAYGLKLARTVVSASSMPPPGMSAHSRSGDQHFGQASRAG